MEKPASLRAEIERALPEIAANPEKLAMFVTDGRVQAYKSTLSHETAYTLSVLIENYSGGQDEVRAVIINWLQKHQADILHPGANADGRYTFEADILRHDAADLLIQLQLTELTRAIPGSDGRIIIDHPKNADHSDLQRVLGHKVP